MIKSSRDTVHLFCGPRIQSCRTAPSLTARGVPQNLKGLPRAKHWKRKDLAAPAGYNIPRISACLDSFYGIPACGHQATSTTWWGFLNELECLLGKCHEAGKGPRRADRMLEPAAGIHALMAAADLPVPAPFFQGGLVRRKTSPIGFILPVKQPRNGNHSSSRYAKRWANPVYYAEFYYPCATNLYEALHIPNRIHPLLLALLYKSPSAAKAAATGSATQRSWV